MKKVNLDNSIKRAVQDLQNVLLDYNETSNTEFAIEDLKVIKRDINMMLSKLGVSLEKLD